MSEAARLILEQIRALPDDDRASITEELLGEEGGGYDPFADPEWRAELDRRIAEVADGTAVLIDAETVFAGVRQRVAEREAVRGGR